MTHSLLPLPSTTFLLLLFLCPLAAAAAATATTVLDINGHPLQAKSNYYILPVFRGRGGGLTMSSKNGSIPCPLNVAQESQDVFQGLPLKLYPVNPKQRHISPSTDLNFVFDAATTCVQSTGWRLTYDEGTGNRYVGTGGEIGNPGVETLSNWFKIEKDESGEFDYKIVFCPSVCAFCKVVCGDVGVFIEVDGKRWLGLKDQPLLVRFKKA